jgi:hypothetical protein
VISDGVLRAVRVRLGITDGSHTEILDGDLSGAKDVVVAMTNNDRNSEPSGVSSMFQVRGGRWFR